MSLSERQARLEALSGFIHEHRSNEGNFEKLYRKLEEECAAEKQAGDHHTRQYLAGLEDIREKQAEAYRSSRDKGGTAWPEYEKFVTQFEKLVVDARKDGA